MMTKKIIILLLTFTFISCNSVDVYYNKEEKRGNKLDFGLYVHNTSNKTKIIPYNLDKLNFSCGYSGDSINKKEIYFKKNSIKTIIDTDKFILENKEGVFRELNDIRAINQIFPNESIYLGPVINHCQDSVSLMGFRPKEISVIGNIEIDSRLLRVKAEDKKVRIWFIHKKQGEIQYVKSNWIDLE